MLRLWCIVILLLNMHILLNAQNDEEEFENAKITVSYVNKVITFAENYHSYLNSLSDYNISLNYIKDPANLEFRNRTLTETPILLVSSVPFLEIKFPLSYFKEKDIIYLKNDLMLYRSTVNYLVDFMAQSIRDIQLMENEDEFVGEIEKYTAQSSKKINNLYLLHERIIKIALKYGEPADLILLLNENSATPYVQLSEEKEIEEENAEMLFNNSEITQVPVSVIADFEQKVEVSNPSSYDNSTQFVEEITETKIEKDINVPVSSFNNNNIYVDKISNSDPGSFSGSAVPNIFTYSEISSPDELMLNDLMLANNLYELMINNSDNIIAYISELVKIKSIVASRNQFINHYRSSMTNAEIQRFRNFYREMERNFVFNLTGILERQKNNKDFSILNNYENISKIEKALHDLQNSYNDSSYSY